MRTFWVVQYLVASALCALKSGADAAEGGHGWVLPMLAGLFFWPALLIAFAYRSLLHNVRSCD